MLAAISLAPSALAQSHGHNGGGGGSGWSRGPGAQPHAGASPNWSRAPGGPPHGGGGPGWGRGPGAPPGGGPNWNRGGGPAAYNWDQRRYNGYWVGGRWYYGAPAGPAFQTPGYRPGFTPWRRGSFLPPNYQNYVVGEYERFHLRRPPYGYHWVQVGGEFLLVSASTGLIFDIVTGY
jgi:Ni/Co efflux regulator RcnB